MPSYWESSQTDKSVGCGGAWAILCKLDLRDRKVTVSVFSVRARIVQTKHCDGGMKLNLGRIDCVSSQVAPRNHVAVLIIGHPKTG